MQWKPVTLLRMLWKADDDKNYVIPKLNNNLQKDCQNPKKKSDVAHKLFTNKIQSLQPPMLFNLLIYSVSVYVYILFRM